MDLESPPLAKTVRGGQEKRLRKRRELDALVVKGTRRRKGASQELLASRGAESSTDFDSGAEEEDASATSRSARGRDAAWRGRRGILLGLKYGLIVGSCLALAVLTVWLHLCSRVELDNLRRQLNRVDDASKSVPEAILQLQALLDKIQVNQSLVMSSLDKVRQRMDTMEREEAARQEVPPQGNIQGIQQGLADLGVKLAEVKQSVEAASSRSAANAQNIQKFENELNSLKLNEIDMKNGGSEGDDVTVSSRPSLVSLNSSLASAVTQLGLLGQQLASLNLSLMHVGQNTSARLDWLDRDVGTLQAKLSQMEDDNRNVSSHVGSLAVSCSTDIQVLKQQLDALVAQLRSAASAPAAAHIQDTRTTLSNDHQQLHLSSERLVEAPSVPEMTQVGHEPQPEAKLLNSSDAASELSQRIGPRD